MASGFRAWRTRLTPIVGSDTGNHSKLSFPWLQNKQLVESQVAIMVYFTDLALRLSPLRAFSRWPKRPDGGTLISERQDECSRAFFEAWTTCWRGSTSPSFSTFCPARVDTFRSVCYQLFAAIFWLQKLAIKCLFCFKTPFEDLSRLYAKTCC